MASRSYDRVDFYRKNRDYSRILDEDGALEEEEEEEEEEDDDEPRQYRKAKSDEAPEVTRERQEYLARRQKLKELERRKLKNGNKDGFPQHDDRQTNGRSNESYSVKEKRKTLPYDNYGSFFGPSQPVVARRVIEETRARLEAQQAAAKTSKEAPEVKKVSTTVSEIKSEHTAPPRVVNETKNKAQQLKAIRDYSFLFSEDAEIPASERGRASETRSVIPSVPDNGRPKQVVANNSVALKKSSTSSKPISYSKDGKGMVSSSKQIPTRVGTQKVSASANSRTSYDPNKQSSKVTSGPGRPTQHNGPLRHSGNSATRVVGPDGDKKRVPPLTSSSKIVKDEHQRSSISRPTGVQKPTLLKAPTQRLQAEQRRPQVLPKSEPKLAPKAPPKPAPNLAPKTVPKPAPKSIPKPAPKPQVRPVKPPISREVHHERPKKRPRDDYDEDVDDGGDYRSLIRQMFRYDPRKYRDLDDQDDSDMEVGFSSIQAEERRSERIAREEDERELELIEAEERAERARAKKRKLKQNQR